MVECYSPLDVVMKYYGNETSNGAHFPFNFMFIVQFNRQSDAEHVYDLVKYWMTNMPEDKWANWVVSDDRTSFPVPTPPNGTVDANPDVRFPAGQSRQPEGGVPDQPAAGGRAAHAANAAARHTDHVLRGRAGRAGHVHSVRPDGGPGRSQRRRNSVLAIQPGPGAEPFPVGRHDPRRFVLCVYVCVLPPPPPSPKPRSRKMDVFPSRPELNRLDENATVDFRLFRLCRRPVHKHVFFFFSNEKNY